MRELYMDTLSFMAMAASGVEDEKSIIHGDFPCLLRRDTRQEFSNCETLELCFRDAFQSSQPNATCSFNIVPLEVV